jgi:Holliday junction resolvase RusA-like endonuclease
MIEIRIPGELRGKGRPRFSARGGFARAFTDAKTANAEAWVKACAVQTFTGTPIAGPVSVQLEIGVAVPKSWPKKRRADALAGAIWPTTKPDLDNQIKLIGDALNGIVWQDDAQIVRAVVSRRYVETPAAVLTVAEV